MTSVRARTKDATYGDEGEFLNTSRSSFPLGSPLGASESRRRVPTWTWVVLGVAGLVALLLLGYGYSGGPSSPFQHDSFITVDKTKFMHKCRPYHVAGFNVDNLAEAILAGTSSRAGAAGVAKGSKAIASVLGQAAEAGLNTISPGVYDEEVFQALDHVIAEAEAAGLRVILSLVDNWKYAGGVDEFVDWADSVPARDAKYPVATQGDGDVSEEAWTEDRKVYEAKRKVLFYTDTKVKSLYRNHIRAVLERINTVSGKAYKDDPTIMAFDLLNEPRCSVYETPDCTKLLEQWVYDMATHLKSLDQKHLVTIGTEGFWGVQDKMQVNNPGAAGGSDWAAKAGQDFIHHHNLPVIDFATFHLWPDNWQTTSNASFMSAWIQKHVEDSTTLLKKPVLLEEFGKKLFSKSPDPKSIAEERDPIFRAVYEEAEVSAAAGSSLAGTMFWRWGFNAWNSASLGEYGVASGASTLRIVRGHAQRLKAFQNTAAPAEGCPLDCWVGVASPGSRRCERQPGVCAAHGTADSLALRREAQGGRLQSAGVEAFASQGECCLPGLGAFAEGCGSTIL